MTPRLTTSVWVSALLRRAGSGGTPATVVHRGYEIAGGVLLLARARSGLTVVLEASTDRDGQRRWLRPHAKAIPDDEVSAFVARQRQFDPDLWVVELETDAAEALIGEPVAST